jgi:chemotaxis protein MotB
MLRVSTAARLAVLLLLPLSAGCVVKKSTHESLRDELARVEREKAAEREEANAERERRDAMEAAMRDELAALEAEVARLTARSNRMEGLFEEARTEVHRLDVLLNERGSEYRQLQERIQRLAAVEREVRQRNQIYEDVIGRFRSLIDGGMLSVSVVRGRMVIHLPQDILFESGSAVIGAGGRSTLAEVGRVLAELEDRSFQVEGHTDNVPIATARFPSNWELSAARSLSVVQLLVQNGVRATNLSGAAYGEFHPVAANDSRESRRLNRRIEIVMLPNLDVIAESELPD